jgi:hypothetical protein
MCVGIVSMFSVYVISVSPPYGVVPVLVYKERQGEGKVYDTVCKLFYHALATGRQQSVNALLHVLICYYNNVLICYYRSEKSRNF